MADPAPMIVLENVGKRYGAFQVLEDCTTTVRQGEVVVLCGRSGSGKSTLLKCINGLESFDSGRITVDGVEVGAAGTDLPALRSRIGMVFQSFELFPHLTVLRNLTLPQRRVLRRPAAAAEAKAEALLQRVGLAEHAHQYPAQLSGGQQQRVAIARALAMDPIAMLFDEPTSALDPEMTREVLEVMARLAADGMTTVCVTHEMGFARQVADRILFLEQGRIVEDCSKEAFFTTPRSAPAQAFLDKTIPH
jgi:glutamate/aspartate transport system ATP-binding protein